MSVVLRVLSALSLLSPKRQEVKFHPIVNLKPLNKLIKYEHFKMKNLDSARYILRVGCWMVKLNLKDAYLTIPVSPSHKKFLRFTWKGPVFQLNCLVFGLALAPAQRLFTEILKVVAAYVRKHGMRLIIYLDDIFIVNFSKEGVSADVKKAIDLIQHLGFIINFDKSILDPGQVIIYEYESDPDEYLGLLIIQTIYLLRYRKTKWWK